jgi:hypothetical protein
MVYNGIADAFAGSMGTCTRVHLGDRPKRLPERLAEVVLDVSRAF